MHKKVEFGAFHTHAEVCDASGAVFLRPGSTEFLVADDEDQHSTELRVYDAEKSGPPIRKFKLDNTELAADPEEPEIDLEGSAWLGDHIFWIGSHSRNKNGKERPSRHRLFATQMAGKGVKIAGKPYTSLIADVAKKLKLNLDNKQSPKDGGISIEGLSATPGNGLLIAFRSPLVKQRALLIELENPEDVVLKSKAAEFGEPILLDLHGLGVRSIDYWPERRSYYLLAGPSGDNGKKFQLMRWSGPVSEMPELIAPIESESPPEALLVESKSETLYMLFDEGRRVEGGVECKKSSQRSFRSTCVRGL